MLPTRCTSKYGLGQEGEPGCAPGSGRYFRVRQNRRVSQRGPNAFCLTRKGSPGVLSRGSAPQTASCATPPFCDRHPRKHYARASLGAASGTGRGRAPGAAADERTSSASCRSGDTPSRTAQRPCACLVLRALTSPTSAASPRRTRTCGRCAERWWRPSRPRRGCSRGRPSSGRARRSAVEPAHGSRRAPRITWTIQAERRAMPRQRSASLESRIPKLSGPSLTKQT